jgi:hypothetical protein
MSLGFNSIRETRLAERPALNGPGGLSALEALRYHSEGLSVSLKLT